MAMNWRVTEDDGGSRTFIARDGATICEVLDKASLPLIEAAPDLLAALKLARPSLQFLLARNPSAGPTASALAQVDAVIAKAEHRA